MASLIPYVDSCVAHCPAAEGRCDLNSNINCDIGEQCDQNFGVASKVDGVDMKSSRSKVDGGWMNCRARRRRGSVAEQETWRMGISMEPMLTKQPVLWGHPKATATPTSTLECAIH